MRWTWCRQNAFTVFVFLDVVAACLFHLPLWYLLVCTLTCQLLLLAALWPAPRMGLVAFQSLFEVVWVSVSGIGDWSALQLPKPFLYADGEETTRHRKEIISLVRRLVFVVGVGTCSSVDAVRIGPVVLLCFLFAVPFLGTARAVLGCLFNVEGETNGSDGSDSEEASFHQRVINTEPPGHEPEVLFVPPRHSDNLPHLLATNLAILALPLVHVVFVTMPTFELLSIMTFTLVTDTQIQGKAMTYAIKTRPHAFDGLLDYAVLAALNGVDFVLCSTLFVTIFYNSYGLVAICLAYCNAFAVVMDFLTRVWFFVRDERAVLANMRHASYQELRLHNDVCAVCLNRMQSARVTPCHHLFHGSCLRMSLRQSSHCPLCQSKIVATPFIGHTIRVF